MVTFFRRSKAQSTVGIVGTTERNTITTGMFVLSMMSTALVAAEPIRYTVSFSDAQNHYIDIEAQFPCDDQRSLELMMPVWTPGSYLIREYARHIESLQANAPDGKSLTVVKTKKNRWQVTAPGHDTVTVKYRIYCREMSVRTNWVEDKFAILNGAPTFVTLADRHQIRHEVNLELPDHWKTSVTSLDRVPDGQLHHYQADNFDELVDSPILCGNPVIYRFNVGQREHLLVNVGEGKIWDGTVSSRELAKIVAEQQRLWDVVPYEKYIFFNLITEARGGLEHDNSTLMMTSRWAFRHRESYLRWLGLASHEFFHTWNVRRLRPRALVNYEYENENYTRSLWIVEGITSYYDNLSLIRAGVCSQKEYFKLLSKDIESLQTAPGRLTQSLRESSYDAWIKFYRPDENTLNSRISYYTKGAVVAFLLDAKIREATENASSLDDVMRRLYQRYSGDRGYTSDDFRTLASEVAGQNLSDWFRTHVDLSQELDYDPALRWYGLRFGKHDPEKANEGDEAEEHSNTNDDHGDETPRVWLGISTRNHDGQLIISQVRRDSPAYQAGLNADDEILGLGDYRVAADQWEARLKQYRPGDQVTILIARRQLLRRVPVTFGTKPSEFQWKLSPARDATEAQQQRLQQWLRVDD